ncbi:MULTISPECIES: TadE/TadG family type IV pilus assembly protein [Alphaproteobacteria]|uniref:Pilus assembly protein TadG n=2 Tax=Alphaproteobacteria TaxID=28211 RepID=A0A512HP40_9HYPH|nr:MULTISPECIES: TadE/TadG family type IV pilus assembly protein [Alphaproteobacteria]GEO87217.1 pilus assembly protein TadG [Ciceribacter naphthalenivorans]GLR23053.1 pilus assembly protein TadG [Ciceribacter naphthalenivorans]GLT05909.1 pilus assembly protein TadG [Sphingomonas psychrolutea]
MRADLQHFDGKKNAGRYKNRPWRHIVKSRDGAAAIEFAILAIPYFMIIFAILETFTAYTAEQMVTNAVNTMARELRTGNITYNLGRSTDMNQTEFRAAFCDEISIMIACSNSEVETPAKLYLDVEEMPTFKDIADKVGIPRTGGEYSDLDTSAFHFSPGGSGSINLLRAYYRWDITLDFIRGITHIRPDANTQQFLIIATTAFQNEGYP